MPFKSIEEFCNAYQRLEMSGWYEWAALDKMLVKVCSAAPDHKQVDEVFAKIAIINRTYRANLQLAASEAERKVAEQFVAGHVDKIIDPLHRISTFSSVVLSPLLDVHEKLAGLAGKITRKVNNSFVSKYLHFHFPRVVPIFDNISYANSWNLARVSWEDGSPPESEYRLYHRRKTCDYGYHCSALLRIIEELKGRKIAKPSPKLLDVLLYGDPSEG